MFHVKHSRNASERTNILLAGGRACTVKWLQSLAKLLPEASVYCADKGASYALAAGLRPTLLVGDCDSTTAEVYDQARKLGAELELHPPAKDDTDLQLLLARMPTRTLVASGVWGGRFDHLFSNVYTLYAYKRQQRVSVVLADQEELLLLLNAGEVVTLLLEATESVQALSLLPLAASSSVSISGVQWELNGAELTQQRPYAISNIPKSKNICCTCSQGAIGLYIHWNK